MSDPFAGEDFWRGDPFGPFREDNAPPPSLRALLTDPRKRPEDEHEYDASIPPFLWAPPPVLATMDPNTAQEGSTVVVTVTGSGYILSSVVHAGTTALPTVYVSETELTATYTPSAPGVVDVTVRNGTRVSNSLPFTVSAIPPPTVATLAPDSSNLSTTTTVVVTGTNYTPASVVHADGVALPTTYTSATSLSAQYTSPATVGEVAFTVHDGPRVSNAVTFTVEDVFTPDRLPGLVGWWDADDVSTLTFSSAAEVSEWADKSVTGAHWTQPTIAEQPTHQAGAQNGHGQLGYVQPDAMEIPIGTRIAVWPYTIYYAMHWFQPGYAQALCAPTIPGRLNLSSDTVTARYDTLGSNPATTWPIDTARDGSPAVFTIVVNTNAPARVNGVQVGTGNHGNDGPTEGLIHGWRTGPARGAEAWRHFIFATYELLVYQGAHDTATQMQVEAYLQDKWATPALPQDLDPSTIVGLDTWLDGADETTQVYSSGTEVAEWLDKSGNDHHATNLVVATQPTGGPVGFYFAPSDAMSYSWGWDMATETFDLFAIAQQGDTSGADVYLTGGGPGTFCLDGFNGGLSYVTSTTWYTTSAPVDRLQHVEELRIWPITGPAHILRDGVLQTPIGGLDPFIPTPPPLAAGLGGGGWFYLRELLVYVTPTGLTDADRVRIRNYLAAKWGA